MSSASSPKTTTPAKQRVSKKTSLELLAGNQSQAAGVSSPASKKKPSPPLHAKPPAAAAHTLSPLEKEEMTTYVLWRRPVKTLYYFAVELTHLVVSYMFKLLAQTRLVTLICLVSGLITCGFYIEGDHQPLLHYLRTKVLWYSYWVGLGIASSIGLGTGLHTFLLYLGPFIAQVTLAAYECNSLEFPEPPFPDQILCPNATMATATATATNSDEMARSLLSAASSVSMFSIMAKVRIESFMWGAGTAIGELPPYFMARASTLSNSEVDDDELAEFEELLHAEQDQTQQLAFMDRMRLVVFKVIKRVGFLGILICASIPNPLFDLAGITCGHFLVPFGTFFGATLIGKAIIKMHIQKIFVIFLFSQHHLNKVFELVAMLPYVGGKLEPLLEEWLNKEKSKLRNAGGGNQLGAEQPAESIVSWVLGKVVMLMILFFVVSIINSLAQRRYKRLKIESADPRKAN